MQERKRFFMFMIAAIIAVVLSGCSFGAGGFKLGLNGEQELRNSVSS